MSTRCITEVRSKWVDSDCEWETNAVIHRHGDGYLDGHGKWLFDLLDGLEVINGIPGNPPQKFVNGPGRLAALIVTELSNDGHDPNLLPNTKPVGQEYHYRIDVIFGMNGGDILMTVFNGPMTAFGGGGEKCNNQLFCGNIEEYEKFLEEQRNTN